VGRTEACDGLRSVGLLVPMLVSVADGDIKKAACINIPGARGLATMLVEDKVVTLNSVQYPIPTSMIVSTFTFTFVIFRQTSSEQ